MTNKNRAVTFFAAGILGITVAARAGSVVIPDPNLADPTATEITDAPGTETSAAHLAAIPDPNLDVSSSAQASEVGIVAASGPELAAVPDPNLAPSTSDHESTKQTGLLAAVFH